MIVVMADVTQEDGAVGRDFEIRLVAQRRRSLGRPPGVEMAAAVPSQARPPPALIDTERAFVELAPRVDHQPLQQQRRPFAHGAFAILLDLLQEVLVAENRVGFLGGAKIREELWLARHRAKFNSNRRSLAAACTLPRAAG